MADWARSASLIIDIHSDGSLFEVTIVDAFRCRSTMSS